MKTYPIGAITPFNRPLGEEYITIDPVSGIKEWYKVFAYKDLGRVAVLHRLDGPARLESNGSESWFKRGYFHRMGGPATTDAFDGTEEWWIMGCVINNYKKYQKLTRCPDEEILLLKLKWGEIAR